MRCYDVAVIGAGSAGIMAAITASRMGNRVVLVERNPQIGRKLLATGNGRCNLTNARVTADRYHGSDREFIETVLDAFDHVATMRFFEALGLLLKEEDNGRVFPRTNQAASVVKVLRLELRRTGVHVMLDAQVKAIRRAASWEVSMLDGARVAAERLIVATGGRAAHHFGSTGDGLYWAEKLGHTLTPIHAALVPMETVETWPKDAQGTKVDAAVRATTDGRTIGEASGDVHFASYGVSGPAVMALARAVAPLLASSRVTLHIDLFPDMTEAQLREIVARHADRTLQDVLVGLVPSGLIPVVARFAGGMDAVPSVLKNLTLTVSQLRRLKEAQVTAGGITADEIDPRTLESRLLPGLHFAGEVLDVDGDSGGFNLQWAWSSGYVAGLLGK